MLPSSIDVYNQHAQQVAHSCDSAAGGATPYVAAIVGPYYEQNAGPQSHMSWFYVENRRQADFSLDIDPAACLQHMVAKHLDVAMVEGATLATSEVLAAATPLVERYSRHPEQPDFCEARKLLLWYLLGDLMLAEGYAMLYAESACDPSCRMQIHAWQSALWAYRCGKEA